MTEEIKKENVIFVRTIAGVAHTHVYGEGQYAEDIVDHWAKIGYCRIRIKHLSNTIIVPWCSVERITIPD